MQSNEPISLKFDQCASTEARIGNLLAHMSLKEKIGQMCQVNYDSPNLHNAIRAGRVGSVLNEVHPKAVNELQRIAVEESRMGIPLLIGRDVIHGFKTIFPIPLGQAASWNPDLVRHCARISALEAASIGVNWTFAPMVDITRDPRWGRIAECLGEDPYLCGELAKAMVAGFQGDDLARSGSLAACAKHFAGYGASEGGRDYNTTNIPENELRNVYLAPFKVLSDAGVASFMTSFGDLNGVPASGNEFLLKQVLRQEWNFQGFVVSDWDSIKQLAVHGLTESDWDSALSAARAGLDMEMVSTTYADHLESQVEEGLISVSEIDQMVRNILRSKFKLALFDEPYTDPSSFPAACNEDHLQVARDAARESCVLLKNDRETLPISLDQLGSIAVIGPLADESQEQLGTWVFDGDVAYSQTGLQAIREWVGDQAEVHYARGLETSISRHNEGFSAAVEQVRHADMAILFVGEDAILSGEAHCRANIDLPGEQQELIRAVADTGTPIVLVIMAGRPLTLEPVVNHVDAILYAWHPGSMGGPAIVDLLSGRYSPSGKLPVTFPRMVGQIPIYYSQKNTGRPATDECWTPIDEINTKAKQHSLGMTSMHLDAGFTPLYPFGYGLSYTQFDYTDISISAVQIRMGDQVSISAELANTGDYAAEEIAQLYIRDLVGNVTRPVKELKAFKKLSMAPGENRRVQFDLHTDDLAFYDRKMKFRAEPGRFYAWIGGSSEAHLMTEFEIVA